MLCPAHDGIKTLFGASASHPWLMDSGRPTTLKYDGAALIRLASLDSPQRPLVRRPKYRHLALVIVDCAVQRLEIRNPVERHAELLDFETARVMKDVVAHR